MPVCASIARGLTVLGCLVLFCGTTVQAKAESKSPDAALKQLGEIAPPPRDLAGLGDLPQRLDDVSALPSCVGQSRRLTSEDVNEIAANMKISKDYKLYLSVHYEALDELRAGQISNALLLQRKAINTVPSRWRAVRGRHEVFMSVIQARAGDYVQAQRSLDSGMRRLKQEGSKVSPACRHRNKYARHRGEGSIAFAAGNMETAAVSFEKAYREVERVRAAKGECEIGARTTFAEMRLSQAEALLWAGRLVDAESRAREAYRLSRKVRGPALILLADIFLEQGRIDHALRSALGAIKVQNKQCIASDALSRALSYEAVSRAHMARGEWQEALRAYRLIEEAMESDQRTWSSRFAGSRDRGLILLKSGNAAQARTVFERAAGSTVDRLGPDHYESLELRAFKAVAAAELGDHAGARASLDALFPELIRAWRDQGGNSTTFVGRQLRLREIAEPYLRLLLDRKAGGDPKRTENLERSFWVADAVGARKVNEALAKGVARFAAKDTKTATLIRGAQDLERQGNALQQRLNEALLSDQISNESLDRLRSSVAAVNAKLAQQRQLVSKAAPSYAALVNPPPAETGDLGRFLDSNEALVVTFVGSGHLFAWSVTEGGKAAATVAAITDDEVAAMVKGLRRSIAPETAATLRDLPTFDVTTANRLYRLTLGALEPAWSKKERVFVIADGPLGSIPFGVLTRDAKAIARDGALAFDGYRKTAFLARSHQVVRLPSASSLMLLRKGAGQTVATRPFVGFGDPIFDRRTASAAGQATQDRARGGDDRAALNRRASVTTRRVSSAEIRDLPRLFDTADELLGIAHAVRADPAQDVYLGLEASEERLLKLNRAGTLKSYRVVSFATHGLVPGDLNGLTQPALVLSEPSPQERRSGQDGLVTPDEVMNLKLDADWVVLSACNTAAGEGAGAEAASGLGQAFFFAGARSVLVSNWPVHSASTRQLMVRTFDRYMGNKVEGRAKALQRAMLDLVDKTTHRDAAGKEVFSYAHPFFWAPFMIVGEGR